MTVLPSGVNLAERTIPRRKASGWYVGNAEGAGRLNKSPPARTPIAKAAAPTTTGTRNDRFGESVPFGADTGNDTRPEICPELADDAGTLIWAREDSMLRLIRFKSPRSSAAV